MKKLLAIAGGLVVLLSGILAATLHYSIPVRTFLGWEQEAADAQLLAFTQTLRPMSKRDELRRRVADYPLLTYSETHEPLLGWVRTPGRWDVKNSVAVLEFRPDDTLLALGYGIVDYAPIKSRGKDSSVEGFPENTCWGTASECKASWVLRHEDY